MKLVTGTTAKAVAILWAAAAVAAPGDITTVAGGPGFGPALEVALQSTAIAAHGTNVYVVDDQVLRRIDLTTGLATIAAGTGHYGTSGDGGPATLAELPSVEDVTVNALGNIFLAEVYDGRIRKIDGVTGMISTVAGGGDCWAPLGGCTASNALITPNDVAIDSTGTIYFLDGHQRVFRIDATGTVVHVAGTGGSHSYEIGDGGPATDAFLFEPWAIAIDLDDDLLIADTQHGRIRKVDATTGIITTVAGDQDSSRPPSEGLPATAANLGHLYEVAVDVNGDVLFGSAYALWRVDSATGALALVAGGDPASSALIGFTVSLSVNEIGDLFLVNSNQVRRVAAEDGAISTVAGSGAYRFSGDGRAARSAQLLLPTDAVADSLGNVFLVDAGNGRIRRIDAATGILATFAGTGEKSHAGDGGPATAASFVEPRSLAIDASGNVYVSDPEAKRVRRVESATGRIDTIAGGGPCCATGDGGPAVAAHIQHPEDLALDGSGGLLIVDGYSRRIRRVDLSTGRISTAVGNGTYGLPEEGKLATETSLANPRAVAVDPYGNVFVGLGNLLYRVDAETGRIGRVATGLGNVGGLAADGDGFVYVAEPDADQIRRIDLVRRTMETIAGSPAMPPVAGTGFAGDGGPASLAMLDGPFDLSIDPAGNLLVADRQHDRIRRIEKSPVCGDGRLDPGESCDDGNREDRDCCSSVCAAHAAGSSCQGDGDLLTVDQCDAAGFCTHEVVPRSDCRFAPRSSIKLLQRGGERRSLTWKWLGGETGFSELGNPLETTGYALLVYDEGIGATIWSGALPAGDAWRPLGGGGFRYRGDDATGLRDVILRSGVAGRATITAAGAGEALDLPLPLEVVGPVVVQLVQDDDSSRCWQSLFSDSARNDGSLYRAAAHD